MIRSVLVPLDGSPFAEHALPLALAIARRTEAALRLVYVHSPLAEVYPVEYPLNDESFECAMKTRQRVYLEEAVHRMEAVAPVSASFDILEGEVAPMIRAEAQRIKADLVVMTTHGRGPLGRFWLGSVADQLVRSLPVPLLLARPAETRADWRKQPVLKRFLVPLDGSPLAEHILEPAIAVGAGVEADYTLLRVVPPVLPPDGPDIVYGPGIEALLEGQRQLEERLRREAQEYLEGIAARLRKQLVPVQTRVALERHAATAILNEATPKAFDAIALATHGRRGLARLFLGSVADKVIRGSTLPVLVHRPAD